VAIPKGFAVAVILSAGHPAEFSLSWDSKKKNLKRENMEAKVKW
jgi:hypothetical protein